MNLTTHSDEPGNNAVTQPQAPYPYGCLDLSPFNLDGDSPLTAPPDTCDSIRKKKNATVGKRYKPKPAGNQYRRRRANLRKLGFSSYREYLKSDMWTAIRERVFAYYGRACKRCGGYATQVHHKKYVMKAMTGENLGLLVPLCARCHEFCEWDGNRKVMSSGANARIRKR